MESAWQPAGATAAHRSRIEDVLQPLHACDVKTALDCSSPGKYRRLDGDEPLDCTRAEHGPAGVDGGRVY